MKVSHAIIAIVVSVIFNVLMIGVVVWIVVTMLRWMKVI